MMTTAQMQPMSRVGGQAPLPTPEVEPVVAVAVADAVRNRQLYILLARPVSELGAHIWNLECPSLQLLARVIKTLFLAIFRWHLCDHLLLLRVYESDNYVFYHSIQGRVEWPQLRELNARYPHLFEKAWKRERGEDRNPNMPLPSAREWGEISAQSMCEYFEQSGYGTLSNKFGGNTITDLVNSEFLRNAQI